MGDLWTNEFDFLTQANRVTFWQTKYGLWRDWPKHVLSGPERV